MKLTKQGDVSVRRVREIMPTTEDFLLVNVDCIALDGGPSTPADNVCPMLFGDRDIRLKIWPRVEGQGKPTIFNTGLKWKTFDMDDNILVMVKKIHFGFVLLVTKKYQ